MDSKNVSEFKYLPIITGAFVGVLLISNIASIKIVNLGWFDFDGGTLLFPLAYIFGDVLTEVYGYARSRKVIWTGFAMALIMSGVFALVGFLPSAVDWTDQKAYMTILGPSFRIVAASLIAYFSGEFSNSFVLAKMKIWTQGRFLWARTIGSTLVGEGLDTLIFCLIAFYGVFPNELLIAVIVSNYIFKVGVEVLFTPITYAVVWFLKKKEGVDVYDRGTKFNPFGF